MEWFICNNEQSEGPYSTDDVKSFVEDGQMPLDSLIWGRGMQKWVTMTQWTKGNYAEKKRAKAQQEILWHYARDGVAKGPMSRPELVLELSNIREKDLILVWTKGMNSWADLFEFPDLIEELGLNRRTHPRAPIKGSVALTFNGDTHICQLRTISEGGVGISGTPKELKLGDKVQIEIKAPDLGDSLTLKAYVQYATQLGYIGLKFEGINQEAKSNILVYIKEQKIVPNENKDEQKQAA